MKILILQLKRIGDLILTTPAIHCLKEQFPQAHLTLVTESSCRGLVEAMPVDETFVYHRGHGLSGHLGHGPNAWIKNNLMGSRPDYCLDFTGTDRSAWFAFASRAQRKITFERFRKKFLRGKVYTDFVDSPVRDRHTADHYTDLLQPLGIARKGIPLDLRLPETAFSQATAHLAALGISGSYAVIHAGTARPEKYWNPDSWIQVIDFLYQQYGLTSVLTGSNDSDEQTHLAIIKKGASGKVADLSGKTNLLELSAIIQKARIFCGVDTAALHLADAMKTPAVALFGPTNPFHWQPRHTASVILRSRTAQPFALGQKGGPMEDIRPETVTAALQTLLKD